MNKIIRRSKGVVILAILLFLVSFDLKSGGKPYFDQYFGSLSGFFTLLETVYNISGILISVGLLFLKDIVRKAVVILHIAYLPYAIMLFITAFPNIAKNFSGKEMEKHLSGITTATIFTIGISVLYLYFFTRPKVKEQFK